MSQQVSKSTSWSVVCKSVSQSVSLSVSQSAIQFVSQSVSQSVSQLASKSVGQLVSQSFRRDPKYTLHEIKYAKHNSAIY